MTKTKPSLHRQILTILNRLELSLVNLNPEERLRALERRMSLQEGNMDGEVKRRKAMEKYLKVLYVTTDQYEKKLPEKRHKAAKKVSSKESKP